MKKTIRFLDCGANVGQSIQWALDTLQGYDFKIDSFEPNPSLIPIIKDAFFDSKEHIKIHQVAVDIVEGENRKFYLQSFGARTGSSLYQGKESTMRKVAVVGSLCYVEPDGATVRVLNAQWNYKECEALGLDVTNETPVFVQYMPSESVIEVLTNKRYIIDNIDDLYNTVDVKTVDIISWIEENTNKDELIILKLDVEGSEYPIVRELINTGVYEKIDVLLLEWTPEERIDTAFEMVGEEKVKERTYLQKEVIEKFKYILDWHHPEDCRDPLKEHLKELEKRQDLQAKTRSA